MTAEHQALVDVSSVDDLATIPRIWERPKAFDIMKIAEELDSGPVSNIYRIKLKPNENAHDISEKLSRILQIRGVQHSVLNAKKHQHLVKHRKHLANKSQKMALPNILEP